MKITVIQRKMDDLGRVVVPIEFRRELAINPEENVPVSVSEPNDDGIFSVDINPQNPNAAIQAELGFLIFPQVYRYAFDLNHCMMDVWVEKGKLRLRKSIPQCAITGETEDLVQYRDTNKYVSRQVIQELYAMI